MKLIGCFAEEMRNSALQQSEWSKIGADVTLLPVEPALLATMQSTVDYDSIVRTVPIPIDEPSNLYTQYFSPGSTYNMLNNTELENLVELLKSTGEHDERVSLHYQIQEIIMDEAVVGALYNSYMIVFSQQYVQDIEAAVHTRTIWGSLNKAYIE